MYADKKFPSEEIADPTRMNVYFISGLGADQRVFSKLQLSGEYKVNYIKWIDPLKNETLKHYAKRLVCQIDTTRPFHLVGLSFGGIVAAELASLVHPRQIIIISSTSTGVPVSGFYQKLIRFLLLHPLAAPVLKSPNFLVYRYFGANTPALKKLLKGVLEDTDGRFLKWALIRLSSWKRLTKPENLYHIHGSADRLIALKLVQPDVVVEGAGHLMVYDRASEISDLLNNRLGTSAED
ncbi:hypothetical protein DYBT9275_04079 [Dyadobacter sp. CECT 9275]|uniref:AB hydrolase-1 domain-containing protein n=2 Tax=Dyadobacter helix TaxID=2822344 RepID=A0A916NDE2_9BACT|nr:hypothetical protein DYBT9275_04079 [Dyadobacter sp. CECT 9275]